MDGSNKIEDSIMNKNTLRRPRLVTFLLSRCRSWLASCSSSSCPCCSCCYCCSPSSPAGGAGWTRKLSSSASSTFMLFLSSYKCGETQTKQFLRHTGGSNLSLRWTSAVVCTPGGPPPPPPLLSSLFRHAFYSAVAACLSLKYVQYVPACLPVWSKAQSHIMLSGFGISKLVPLHSAASNTENVNAL